MADTATDPAVRMRLFAQEFSCLWNAPGIRPWKPLVLDEWAASGVPSHGELCTARFVLSVWNPDEEWKSGRFDLMEALRCWDAQHHQAFLSWASNPWWV